MGNDQTITVDDVPDDCVSLRVHRAIASRPLDVEAPLTVGRYELGALLGRGGMGTVHAAWDPQLRRRVAIKRILGSASEASRMRLHREAAALAALSHPNVVTVYEVGRDGGELFVVMELVEGESLLQWLARHPHFDRARFESAFELLLQAGRGLAAAHAAGILHRDVKPGNMLVGRDPQRGFDAVRVRVADFGLARGLDSRDTNDDRGDPHAATSARETRDGVGTPAYMSPEQVDGGVADARSDQFAFCLTACEAIWGYTPFPASNPIGRRVAIDDGPLPPPPGRGVPRGLFRVLVRGLADVPGRRYPDMDALLAALEPFTRRRPLWPLAAGALATVGAVAFVASSNATAPSAPDPCARSQPLGEWWQQGARASVVDAVGARLGDDAVARIDDAAALYVGRYDDTWARACDLDDEAEREARLGCLAQHRNQVEIAADALANDERVRIEQGAGAILQLDDPGRCNHAATSDLRDDALERELKGALARARAEAAAGRTSEALARVVAVMARAQASARPQIEARARLAVARLLANLDDAPASSMWADSAYDLAIVAGDDIIAAGAAILALSEAGDLGSRPGAELRGRAEAAVARAEHDPVLVTEHDTALGFFLRHRGDLDGSEAAYRRALALGVETRRDDVLWRIEVLLGLASTLRERQRLDEVYELRREVVDLAEAELGPRHPITLRARAELADSISQFDQARGKAMLEELVGEFELVLGTSHPAYAVLMGKYATVQMTSGEVEASIATHRRLVSELERRNGPYGRMLSRLHYQIGFGHLARGRIDDAEHEMRTSFEIAEATESEGAEVVRPAIGLAHVLAKQNDHEGAIAILQRTIAVLDRHTPDGRTAEVLYQLGASQFDSGRFDDARSTLARAIPITAASFGAPSQRMAELLQLEGDMFEHDGDNTGAITCYQNAERMMVALEPRLWRVIGYARLRLAELHWAGGDTRAARDRASAAIEAYRQDPQGTASIERAQQWLDEHPAVAKKGRRGALASP